MVFVLFFNYFLVFIFEYLYIYFLIIFVYVVLLLIVQVYEDSTEILVHLDFDAMSLYTMPWSCQRKFWQAFLEEASAIVNYRRDHLKVHGDDFAPSRTVGLFMDLSSAEKSLWIADDPVEELSGWPLFQMALAHIEVQGGFSESYHCSEKYVLLCEVLCRYVFNCFYMFYDVLWLYLTLLASRNTEIPTPPRDIFI